MQGTSPFLVNDHKVLSETPSIAAASRGRTASRSEWVSGSIEYMFDFSLACHAAPCGTRSRKGMMAKEGQAKNKRHITEYNN